MSDQQKYTSKLKDAKVLVVGGSSGIGFAAAEAALEYGAQVIVSSSQQKRVDNAVNRLKAAYPSVSSKVTGIVCGLGDETTMEQNVQEMFAKIDGNLDHIIFSAGDPLRIKNLQEASLEYIKQAGMVRFFGAIIVCKYGSKHMNPGPASSIVLTTGGAGERPIPNWSIIEGYLSGLQGMMRGLALDLAPIRVNLVSPGAVDTELWDGFSSTVKDVLFKKFSESTATGRVGKADDVAEAYLYCMKDHNLTGSMISTNGGQLLMG